MAGFAAIYRFFHKDVLFPFHLTPDTVVPAACAVPYCAWPCVFCALYHIHDVSQMSSVDDNKMGPVHTVDAESPSDEDKKVQNIGDIIKKDAIHKVCAVPHHCLLPGLC